MNNKSFKFEKPNPKDYGLVETEIEELKSQYKAFEEEKNKIPLAWDIIGGIAEFLSIFSVPGLIFTGLMLLSMDNDYLRLVPVFLLVFLTPLIVDKIIDKTNEKRKSKYSFNRMDEYNNLKKYERELMKYDIFYQNLNEEEKKYIDSLVKQSENWIDHDDAETFIRIIRLRIIFGKDEVLTLYNRFSDSIKEKYGPVKAVFRLSYFLGALESAGIINSEETKSINNEYTRILQKEIIENEKKKDS